MLLDQVQGSRHQAVLAKLTGAGEIASTYRFDVPSAVLGFSMSDDDATVALDLGSEPFRPFVLARVGADESTTTTSPVIDGWRVGLVSAAAADGWPAD
jgi:hypothetical protein